LPAAISLNQIITRYLDDGSKVRNSITKTTPIELRNPTIIDFDAHYRKSLTIIRMTPLLTIDSNINVGIDQK